MVRSFPLQQIFPVWFRLCRVKVVDNDENSDRLSASNAATSSDERSAPGPGVSRLFPWLLLALLVGILAYNMLRQSDVRQGRDTPLRAGSETGQHVQLTIDYGDGAERHFTGVPWCANMTVFDALLWAAHHPHGIAFEYQGTGAHGAGIQTLVLAIDSVANQGGGDSARNWVYEVNGRKAQDSCGVHLLQPADTILWKFTTY